MMFRSIHSGIPGNPALVSELSLTVPPNGGARVPPVEVRVANSYSAIEKPALLWAVTLRLYQVAGFRSRTTKFPPGLTLLDTRVHSFWFLGLYSTTKYIMGHPPSCQAFRCRVTLPADTSRNLLASGTVGSTPLVL